MYQTWPCKSVPQLEFSLKCLIFLSISSPPTLLLCRPLVLWHHHNPASSEHSGSRAKGCEGHTVLPEWPQGPHPLHPGHAGPGATAVWHASLLPQALCYIFLCNKVYGDKCPFSENSKEGHFNLRGKQSPINTGPKSHCFQWFSLVAMGAYLVPLLHLRAIMSSITSANSTNCFKCIFGLTVTCQSLKGVWLAAQALTTQDSTPANSKGLVLIFPA